MAAAPYARRALPASTVHGLLLVATLGNPRYLSNVGRSVHSHFSGWDCIAYMHSTAPLNATFEHCRVVRRYGWGWASLLNLTTPAVVAPYTHVCVLLDDVILPTRSFRLTHVLATMHAFKLDVASPAVLGGHFSGTDPPQINSTSRSHPAFLTESLPYPARTNFTNLVAETCATGCNQRRAMRANRAPRGSVCDFLHLGSVALSVVTI